MSSMSNHHIVILIALLFLVDFTVLGSTNIKRQTSPCDDSWTTNCPALLNETGVPFRLYRVKTNRIVITFSSKCEFEDVKYLWQFYSDDTMTNFYHNDNSSVKVIGPFEWTKGLYSISVFVSLKRNGVLISDFIGCELEMVALDPVAVIDGGSYRMLPAGRQFVLNGSNSYDRDLPPNTREDLSPIWTCEVVTGSIQSLCSTFYAGEWITVPPNYAISGYKYLFNLKIVGRTNRFVWTTQTITISEDVTPLVIVCEKNCPPAASSTDRKRVTYLRVKCLEHCEDIEDSSYEWTVDGDFDYQKATQYGRNTDRFIIKENVFDYGKIYNITVKLIDRQGLANVILRLPVPINIDKCQVKPPEGTALSTKFKVNCNFTGIDSSTEVYTQKKNKSVVLTKSPRLEFVEFLLPSGVDVYLRMTDINDFHDVYKLDVQVHPRSENLISLVNSLNMSVSRTDMDSVVQIINGIIQEIPQKSPSEIKKLKQILLQNLEETKMKSRDEARQISSLVAALVHDPESDSDPHQGHKATEICKEAANIHLETTRNESFPTTLTEKTQQSAATLMSCAETDTKENFKILKPAPSDFEVTTPFPLLDIPVIDEEYPNYETDVSVFHKQKRYELASINFMEICKKSLETLSFTVAEGEETVAAESTNSSAQITKLTGEKLAQKEIEIRGARLQPSRDFEKIVETITCMVCSWTYNPFWWSGSKRVISTNVLLVRIVKNGEDMTEFEKPNKIKLNLQHEGTILTHKIEIVNNSIVRIDVKKDEGFFVKFRNLSETDSPQVLISNFYKPEEHEVRKRGRVVTKNDHILYQDEENGFDSWYYLAVLPESDMNQFTYWVNIYTQSCYSWGTEEKEWTFACKGSSQSSDENIECLCTHLSILAGQICNSPIKIDEVTTEPDFEMVLLNSFIIFIASSAIFGLYCLLAIVVVFKKTPKKKSIFLPADISTSARHVYLVGIRTGRRSSSGTSSNICIKLFGTQNESYSHVLNYPDPQKRIFQRNNTDWFIIPTSHRLGDLTQIALWSDYSGRSPRWFCPDVTIYDMQSNQKWYFYVNTWFSLPPKGHVYVEVKTSKERRKRRFTLAILRLWPKRSHQEGFTYFEKITFLLSVFVMLLGYCMIIYGVPSLTLKDGFAKVEKYKFNWRMIWVGCGSALGTFVCHMTFVYLFRNSGYGRRFSKKITILCLYFLTIKIVILMVVLTMLGFWVPEMNGYLWLTSTGVAIVAYFFILENCYELWVNFQGQKKLPREEHLEKMIQPIQAQRAHLFRKFGEHLLRPYFKHLYRPLDENDIKEKKINTMIKKRLLLLLEDTVMFACYVSLLYLAIFAQRNHLTIDNHKQMISLLSGHHTRTEGYESIKSIDDIYDYVNNTLIPTLHVYQWYGKYVVKEPGIMADFHNKFLGVTRLRQRRVVVHSCYSTNITNETCRSEYIYSKQSRDYFGTEYNDLDRLAGVWNYTNARKAGISVYVGKFGIYQGGGFLAPLGRTLFNSYANLFYLKNNSWLNSATSVVMIEFLAYNVNTNLFSAVMIVLERSATGYMRSKLDLRTSQFLFVENEKDVVQVVIFLSFGVVVAIFTLKFLSRIWREKLLMWKDLWTLVDLLIIALSYTSFVIFVLRAETVKSFLDKIEGLKKNEFIQYFELLYEDSTFTLIAAFLIFVATIRLWKVCRFGTIFKIMEQTLLLSAGPIFLVLVFQITVIAAFTLCGYVLFGSISRNFKDVPDTLITLMLLMMGLQTDFDIRTLISSNPHIGKAYYGAYMLLNLFFLTIYICVIMIHYYEARVVSSEEFTNVIQFFSKQFTFYKTSLKIILTRLKGGTSKNRRFVTPKPDELRYAKCITLSSNTLEMMACVALNRLKTYAMTKKEQLELMKRVVRCSRDGDGCDIFYNEKETNGSKIIHDNKIKLVAAAAELILDFGEKKRERRRKKYKKVMTQNLLKLDFIKQILETMLHVVSNVEIQ